MNQRITVFYTALYHSWASKCDTVWPWNPSWNRTAFNRKARRLNLGFAFAEAGHLSAKGGLYLHLQTSWHHQVWLLVKCTHYMLICTGNFYTKQRSPAEAVESS